MLEFLLYFIIRSTFYEILSERNNINVKIIEIKETKIKFPIRNYDVTFLWKLEL